MSRNILFLIAILLVGSLKCQDAPVRPLPTNAPKTTTTNEIPEETTVSDFDDDHTVKTPTLPPPENQVKGSDENDDNKLEWKNTPPLNILPPSDEDCDLPTRADPINPSPIPVPPIYQPTTDKPINEVINQCPIGFILRDGFCLQPSDLHSCPSGYEWKEERCVKKQIACPLNFDFDARTQSCIEKSPEPQCPIGFRWNGLRCEIIVIQCQPGSVLKGNECVIESITCPSGFTLINNQCIKPPPVCPPGYELKESGFCSQVNVKCPQGSILVNGECQRVSMSCPPGTQQIGNQCYETTTMRRPPSDLNR
jgi:hypothetical protein